MKIFFWARYNSNKSTLTNMNANITHLGKAAKYFYNPCERNNKKKWVNMIHVCKYVLCDKAGFYINQN